MTRYEVVFTPEAEEQLAELYRYIEENATAAVALDRIEGDLRPGTPWEKVYEKYADEFRANDDHTISIGNLGHFVMFQDPQLGRGHFVDIEPHVIAWEGEELPRRLSRLRFLDASHVVLLTHTTSGGIVRLHSAVYHQTVLYQVQEVYSGRPIVGSLPDISYPETEADKICRSLSELIDLARPWIGLARGESNERVDPGNVRVARRLRQRPRRRSQMDIQR